MSIWDAVRQHRDQQQMFRRAIERGRLSQSYLFVGPDGIGKQLFARKLAQCLLCLRPSPADPLEPCGDCAGCRPFLADSHPDFLAIGCPEGKRELPIALLVGTDERRGQEGLCHDLSLAPLPGSRKVAIINDADTMNDASANAFLKTLEEPPARAVLLLIASNLDAILPTIRSRCQLVRFSALPETDVEELLIEHNLAQSSEEAHFAATLSSGSVTVACQLLDPELRALRVMLYSQLSRDSFSGLDMAKKLVEALNKISSETAQLRQNTHWLIRFAIEYFRTAMRSATGSSVVAAGDLQAAVNRFQSRAGAMDVVAAAIDRLTESSRQLDQNVTVLPCLEALCDDLARMLRTDSRT